MTLISGECKNISWERKLPVALTVPLVYPTQLSVDVSPTDENSNLISPQESAHVIWLLATKHSICKKSIWKVYQSGATLSFLLLLLFT